MCIVELYKAICVRYFVVFVDLFCVWNWLGFVVLQLVAVMFPLRVGVCVEVLRV